ncbi:MAG: hypothetical protein AAGA37_09150 [Actinomycetota bacterium]
MIHSQRPGITRLMLVLACLALLVAACSEEEASLDGFSDPEPSASASTAPETNGDDADGSVDAEPGDSSGSSTETADAGDPGDDDPGTDDADANDPDGAVDADANGDAAADGDDGDPDQPVETTTTTVAATPESTTTLPAESGLPPVDERGQNDAGVRLDLDETATLACANAEFARDAVRDDLLDDARFFASAAADRAEPSAVTELADLVAEMRAAQTGDEISAIMTTTLDVCVDHGHQL